MSLAAIIIASEKRRETTFPQCLASVMEQQPDEIIVVADFAVTAKGVRSFVVEPMLRNTIDALVKRDVGALAVWADDLLYLCDDHILAPEFVDSYRVKYGSGLGWDILVPSRYCWRNGLDDGVPAPRKTWLNVGVDRQYAGGHACIEHRACVQAIPWSSTLHHPNWDLIRSHQLTDLGFRLKYAEYDLAVVDIEGGTPWL